MGPSIKQIEKEKTTNVTRSITVKVKNFTVSPLRDTKTMKFGPSAPGLLLLLLSLSSSAAAKADQLNNKNTKEVENQHLYQDDENFWNRFMIGHVSSSFTEEPSAAPSATPSEEPSASPSQAPTSQCIAEVSKYLLLVEVDKHTLYCSTGFLRAKSFDHHVQLRYL